MKKVKIAVLVLAAMLLTACTAAAPYESAPTEKQCQHHYVSKVTTAATCTEDGERTFTCLSCGDTYTEAIAAVGQHNYFAEITSEPNCVADGVKTFTCAACNDAYTEVVVTNGDHNYKGVVTTPETCQKTGVMTYTCPGCKDSYTETIPANGQHNYTSRITKEATCTKDGVETFTCTGCNKTYTEKLDAFGHSWTDATCTKAKTCSTCKATDGKALGHTTSSGTCSRCAKFVFSPLVYSGKGDKVITGINLPKGSFKATLTHVGKSNFITRLYYGEESYQYESLTNEIGNYSGTRALLSFAGKELKDGMLQVKADGEWTVTISQVTGSCTTNIKGNGTVVTGLFSVSSGRNVVTLTHKGKSNFIVKVIRENGESYNYESLTNEIGNYSGQKVVTLDTKYNYYIEIRADGEWTIDFGLGDAVTTYTTKTPTTPTPTPDPEPEPEPEPEPSGPKKWSYSDATSFNSYAKNASTQATKAYENAVAAMSASYGYDVLYNQYALLYAGYAQDYLESLKELADNRAVLTLTGSNSNYSTLQEKIDYVLGLCKQLEGIKLTTDNYEQYEELILDLVQEISMECLGIQKLSVSLLEAFL